MAFRPANLVHTDEAALAESTPSEAVNGSPEPGESSSAEEHHVHTVGVVGSNPSSRTTPRRRRSEFVYFVLSPGEEAIKIGVAVDPFERLATLQQGNPCELELCGCICGDPHPRSLEASLHARFAHARIRGEWFECTADLVDYMDEHCNHEEHEVFCGLRDAYFPEPAPEPVEPVRPQIPEGVEAPKGNSRQARMQRYLLARGLTA